jgi:outer membrane protein
MKVKVTILILIFSCLSLNITNAQEKISLSQAISIALNQNSSIVKSTNSITTSEAAVKNAYGNLIPTLNFGSSWSWQRTSNSQATTVVGYLGENQTQGAQQTDTRSYSMSLSGNVTVFDGLSTPTNISMQKNNLQSAKYDLEKLRQDVTLQTVNLFVTVVNNERILSFQEEDQKYNQDLLKKVKEMVDLKMATNADLYSQEYQTSNSQLSYLQAKSNFEKSKISMLNYLSKDVLKDYAFEIDSTYIPSVAKYTDDMREIYQTALDNRSDYRSQQAKLLTAQYQATIANSGLFPSLTGNYSLSTSSTQPSDLFTRKVYSFGLSLNFPIFSHWNTDYSIQSAKIQVENTQEDLTALERQIKSDVKNAIIDLQTTKLQFEVTKAAVKSSKETWSIKKDSYLLGSATFIDQQQAYRDYVQAMNNEISAESNYIYKQFSLLSAIGLLKTN